MRGAPRGGRRRLVAAAAIGLGVGAVAAWGPHVAAQTATSAVVQAEGDAYALYGEASLLGGGPIHVGPASPSVAYVPPHGAQHATASLVNCKAAAPPICVDPMVDGLNVHQSNADAGLNPLTTNCEGAPPEFGGDHILGGNACETIASVAALNSGTADQPTPQLFASAVTAQAQVQGCDYKKAVGKVEIANLSIGGTEVVGPSGIDLTPAPNTVIPLGLITVILNEQHFDNQGHGLTVNAIHVFTSGDIGALANVDLIIGHAHAEDMCGGSDTVTTPPANTGASGQQLPTGTKLDSTKHANPGEVVTYTLNVATNGCEVVSLTDTLPSGFTYVPNSAAGDLGKAPITSQTNPETQQLEFYFPSGLSAAKLTETLQVKVPDDATPGDYVNNVEGESSPPATNGTITCGSFVFSDTLPLNGPISANNGNNPGIIVPRSGGQAAATPTPSSSVAGATATPAPSATPTPAPAGAAPVATPNTGASSPAGWATPAGVVLIVGGLLLARRRLRARQH